jgi:Uma2 family endonuclease
MQMVATEKIWTASDLEALPDDRMRYEIIDGVLFATPTPSWRHGDAVLSLWRIIDPFLSTCGAGDVRFARAAVGFDDQNVVEPDLFVVPLVNGRRPREWEEVRRLLLAVEVVSPESARQDRVDKRLLYQRQGVPEYWVVDVDAELVWRWRPADERPEILIDRLDWQPSAELAPLSIDLDAYFRDIRGE